MYVMEAGMLAAIVRLPTISFEMRHLALKLNIKGVPEMFYARGDNISMSVHFNPLWGSECFCMLEETQLVGAVFFA